MNNNLIQIISAKLGHKNIFEPHLLKIHTFPDPVLKKVAKPVSIFNDEIAELSINMLNTMYLSSGVGLAAPQIGQSIRLFVIDINYTKEYLKNNAKNDLESRNNLDQSSNESSINKFKIHEDSINPYVFINPQLKLGEKKIPFSEGCLSLPGVYEEVFRSESVFVSYRDIFGNEKELNAHDLLSVCIQHENDHLEGIVLLDKLGPVKQNLIRNKLIKFKNKKK
jgi:peptide deformylase